MPCSQIYLIDLNNSYVAQKSVYSKIFSSPDNTTTLDNKYFTAELQLNTGDCLTLSHEAILVTINNKTSVDDLKESLERFDSCKLKLVTYRDDEVNRSSLMSLCMDFEAELIDLDDLEDGEKSEDLVMDSLNAISWKSAKMKNKSQKQNKKKKSPENSINSTVMPEINSKDVEDFENLFQQLGNFRDQAKNLNGEARLDFAEKIMEQLMGGLDLDSEDDAK